MTLQLIPTNGLTLGAFLEENGDHIYRHTGPSEVWTRAGADRLPVFLVEAGEHKRAIVGYERDEVLRIYETENSHRWEIYLVKIVDLIPHVERLEARLKECLRREQTRKRIGRFALPFEEIEGQTPFARAILDKVFIVRAEALFFAKEVSYIAYSDMFEEVQIGMKPPDYFWTGTRDETGKIVELKADRMDSSAPSILDTVLKRKTDPA